MGSVDKFALNNNHISFIVRGINNGIINLLAQYNIIHGVQRYLCTVGVRRGQLNEQKVIYGDAKFFPGFFLLHNDVKTISFSLEHNFCYFIKLVLKSLQINTFLGWFAVDTFSLVSIDHLATL